MVYFVSRRLVSALSVVLATLIATFALFFVAPTDPAAAICGERNCTQERYNEINQAGLLPDGDIKSCPAQYQQDVKSFTQVLQPHVNGTLNFQAPPN